jgi:hypothetical protein
LLAALLVGAAAAPLPAQTAPEWAGTRQHRILVMVMPDSVGRVHDERPAEIRLNFADLLPRNGIAEGADLSILQIMRYDPQTGKPLPYRNNLFAETPYDLPLQWYDAAIPDPFPERHFSYVLPTGKAGENPWSPMPHWGYYYDVNGDWKQGRLAWTHVQDGDAPSYYAAYFDTLKRYQVPAQPTPRGWIGDGAHRAARLASRSTGLLHGHCRMADMDQDGLLDIVCGSGRGGAVWYRNFGTRQSPRFTVARLLFQSDGKAIDPGFYAYPAVVDWTEMENSIF